MFLLAEDKVGKRVRNSTLHLLQTEVWTETVRDRHHSELIGGRGGQLSHHEPLLKIPHSHQISNQLPRLGTCSLHGVFVSVVWAASEAFYFFNKVVQFKETSVPRFIILLRAITPPSLS